VDLREGPVAPAAPLEPLAALPAGGGTECRRVLPGEPRVVHRRARDDTHPQLAPTDLENQLLALAPPGAEQLVEVRLRSFGDPGGWNPRQGVEDPVQQPRGQRTGIGTGGLRGDDEDADTVRSAHAQ